MVPATCCCTASCPRRPKSRHRPPMPKHTMVDEQMQFFLRGFRRDAHPMAVVAGLVGALSAFYPRLDQPARREPARHLGDPPHREDADAGGNGLQSTAAALHVPAQRPVVHREFHANAPCSRRRARTSVERRAGPVDGPASSPSRGPRRRHVVLDDVRLCTPSTPIPSRRSRRASACLTAPADGCANGLPQHALQHSEAGWCGEDRRLHREGEEQVVRRQADRLRPPRLQELRPRARS